MTAPGPNRRALLTGALGGALGATLGGCDRIVASSQANGVLKAGEGLTERAQRWLVGSEALAREYPESAISPDFRANGTTNPDNPEYQEHLAAGFADWRLTIGGLVERPLTLSLDDLRAAPSRTQITRHDCVEGWSSIGK